MRASWALAILTALLGAGCADLPVVSGSVCGNGVLEPGEDCDALRGSESCVPAGQVGQCRWRCAAATATATAVTCPSGWGCGQDGLCRVGSAQLTPLGSPLDTGEGQLASGDFDADGVPDLVATGDPDVLGQRSVRTLFLGRDGLVQSQVALPLLVGAPVLADLTQDQRTDLIFPYDAGPVVLAGQRGRTFLPQSYPLLTEPLGAANPADNLVARGGLVRFRNLALEHSACVKNAKHLGRAAPLCAKLDKTLPVNLSSVVALDPNERLLILVQTPGGVDLRADLRSELAAAAGIQGVAQCSSTNTGLPLPQVTALTASDGITPGLLSGLTSIVVGGADLTSLGGACDRLFLPLVGGTSVLAVRPCGVDAPSAPAGPSDPPALDVSWRLDKTTADPLLATALPALDTIKVPPKYAVEGRVFVVDINNDGFSDVLIGVRPADKASAPTQLLVAYGQFDGTFSSSADPDLATPDFTATELPFSTPVNYEVNPRTGGSCPPGYTDVDGGPLVGAACRGCSPGDSHEVNPDGENPFCLGALRDVLAVGHFDHDNVPDFVTPAGVLPSYPLFALFGKSYTERPTHELAYSTLVRQWDSAVVGDFNADGRQDIAAAQSGGPGLDLLLLTAAGTFDARTAQTTDKASQLRVGDIDGDQVDDLVFKEQGLPDDLNSGALTSQQLDPLSLGDSVKVIRGQASGRLGDPELLSRPGYIELLEVGPLEPTGVFQNPDQVADVGVISRSVDGTQLQFSVLYGQTGGIPLSSFGIGSGICQGQPRTLAVTVGDLDGDRNGDVIALTSDESTPLDFTSPPTLRLWAVSGTGKGKLGASSSLPPTLAAHLQPLQTTGAFTLKGLLQAADAAEESTELLGGNLSIGARLTSGDLDHDGRDEVLLLAPSADSACFADIIAARAPNMGNDLIQAAARGISFLCNSTLVVARPAPGQDPSTSVLGGAATQLIALPVGTMGQGFLRLLDLDGDGFAEVVFSGGLPATIKAEKEVLGLTDPVLRRSEVYVLWNDHGTLQTSPVRLFEGLHTVHDIALLNVDDDPIDEVVITTDEGTWLAQPRDGRQFDVSALAGLPAGGSLTTGDIDGDGLADLIIGQDTQAQIYRSVPRLP